MFSLINEEVRIDEPTEISYVFSGLAPLSVRFIELIMCNEGFKAMANRKFFQFVI